MKKLFTNLTFWVLIAITAAILVGHFAPSIALQPLLKAPLKTKLLGQEINIGSTLSEFLAGIFISAVKLLINPIIFRSPILTMPKVMVRKMMGLIRSLTALINMPARNSLRVEPMFISWPSSFVFTGVFNTGCKAMEGAK